MIIATFNYGFNVSVKDSGGTTVWHFSTDKGQYFSRKLPAGTYTVAIGIPERTQIVDVSADDLVGAVGIDADFTLQTARGTA